MISFHVQNGIDGMTRIFRIITPRQASLGLISCAVVMCMRTDFARAQSNNAFNDAYGTIIGPSFQPKLKGKDFFVTQQSNMAGRGNTNAGVNPRGNVDVNPPGFVGDNPFGNSTVPNP